MTDIDTDAAAADDAAPPTPPSPPPELIGEPWFFPERISVAKVPPDPDDISPPSTDHHVVSRPSRLGKTWQVAMLSSVVIVVLVALMITGGRALRSSGSATRPKLKPPAGVPSNWIAYRDPGRAFLLWHPTTWVVDRAGSETDLIDPVTNTRLRVDHHDPLPQPLETQWLEAEKSFAATHPDYERLQIGPTTYGGAPAGIWEYTYSDDGAELHAATLVFATAQSGYTLAFQAPAADWDRLLPLFTAYKTSFRIPPSK